jgi:hypothetical protein
VCLENCDSEHSTLTDSLSIVNAIRQGGQPWNSTKNVQKMENLYENLYQKKNHKEAGIYIQQQQQQQPSLLVSSKLG